MTGHVTLIPRFGLLGAAAATAAGQAARVIVMTVAAQRLYHIPYETGRLLRTALAGLVVYAAAGFAPADVSAQALIVRGGLLAAFPLALIGAGVVDRDALKWLRARAAARGAPPPLRTGGTGVTLAPFVISGFHHSGTTLVPGGAARAGRLHVRKHARRRRTGPAARNPSPGFSTGCGGTPRSGTAPGPG